MIKIIVDAFGGDKSPIANIEGGIRALQEKDDLSIAFAGDEKVIKDILKNYKCDESRVSFIDAIDVISCNEQPSFAVFHKGNSSLMKSLDTLKKDESFGGMVTASSTGALLIGSIVKLGKIKGVLRPCLCPLVPTMNRKFVAVNDSGANVDCSKEELVQFAIMGATYLKEAYGMENPRVALLNIGAEETKGDALRKEVYPLLKECKAINFVGNIESRYITKGDCDLIVADGFAGNIAIKAVEGTGLGILKLLKETFYKSTKNKIAAGLLKKDIMDIKDFMNPNNYGGAVLLGVNRAIVKAHGSSNSLSIYHSVVLAYNMAKTNLVEKLKVSIDEALN